MKPNQGRLQTGEHILARIIQNKIPDARVIIARFDYENLGSVDFLTAEDLRPLNKIELEKEVNEIIAKNLKVTKTILQRKQADKEFDLSKIPESVNEIRIVRIEGFDSRPCKDLHVDNTSDIGYFQIFKIEKAGKDRFRVVFGVIEP